ncbi:MAG: DUF1343 domain-containing protein [Endomicrobia bacterium]|nr:DUF1343 domain-containing protein [Endomicrobiia bacterium]
MKNSLILGCKNFYKLNKYKHKTIAIVTTFATRAVDEPNFPPVVEYLLSKKFQIKKIFSPEHGYYLVITAGENVDNSKDLRTNLPIYSLYGKNKEILPEWVKDIDVIFYDINDLGLRFYTFGSTLYYVLLSAKKCKKPVVILDRPNPLTANIVDGNILDIKYKSFVGITSVPVRHGLTQAEFALYLNNEENINAEVDIIPMINYNRTLWWDEIYKSIWFNPSPNINNLNTALIYSGTCLFEGVNVSFGSGTTRPFEIIGAPWINSKLWYKKIKKFLPFLHGVNFAEIVFVPRYGNYKDQLCKGLQVIVYDRNKISMFNTAVAMIWSLYHTHKRFFKWIPCVNEKNTFWIDKLAGGTELRNFVETSKPSFYNFILKCQQQCKQFKQKTKKFLLY